MKDDKFNDDVKLSYEVKKAIEHFDNKEHYQTEQQKEHCVSYDEKLENHLFNEKHNVEFIIQREEQLKALKKALKTLSSEDKKMIRDNFYYDGKRPTYTELAQSYGITRQAYTSRLNRILAKLRKYVEYYLNNE